MKKTLVVTMYFPPHTAGVATILGNLFRNLDPKDFCLLGYRHSALEDNRIDPAYKIDCASYYCSFPDGPRRRFPNIFQEHRNQYLLIPTIVAKGLKVLSREGVHYIMADINANGGAWLLSAYLLHLISRKPLVLYGIDLWEETVANSRLERMMARLFERRIFRAAHRVFVISAALRDVYHRKYGISPDILPIPIELPAKPEGPTQGRGQIGDPLIAFTGSVYSACLDALQNLVKAIDSLPNGTLRLFLATSRKKNELEQLGIQGARIESAFLSKEESQKLQREASILFLPQAFNSGYQPVINTLFPSKTVEYLVSGTPILVHAPAECQIAQYAKEHGFALVVDKPDVEELRGAVTRLLQDQSLRAQLVARAWDTAVKYHDAKKAAGQLEQALS